MKLTGRERARVARAQQNGYLNATCQAREAVREAYGLWCWRLRIPAVWFERQAARSRYARVGLEMFTTPNALTGQGAALIRAIGEQFEGPRISVSPHDAALERIPFARAGQAARAVFRAAMQPGSCAPGEQQASPPRLLQWKIPA